MLKNTKSLKELLVKVGEEGRKVDPSFVEKCNSIITKKLLTASPEIFIPKEKIIEHLKDSECELRGTIVNLPENCESEELRHRLTLNEITKTIERLKNASIEGILMSREEYNFMFNR